MSDPIQDLDDAIERYVEACEANDGHLPSIAQALRMIADRLDSQYPKDDHSHMRIH